MHNRFARKIVASVTAVMVAAAAPAAVQANKGGVPNSHAGNHPNAVTNHSPVTPTTPTSHRNTSCKDTKRHSARKGKAKGFSKHGAGHGKGLHCGHA
jgi:hypothetical protein